MERIRKWKYPVGTRLLHSRTGQLYIVSSDCKRFGDGKYGYTVKDTEGGQVRITLDVLILKKKYCLAS